MFTLAKTFNDQGEMDKGQEHHVELLESGEDAAKSFEATEQALDFVASPIHGSVVLPGGDPVLLGWNHGYEAQVDGQLAGFVALVGAVHEQVDRPCRRSQLG